MQLRRARLQHNFGEAAVHYDAQAEFQHVQTRRVLDSALMLLPRQATLADIGCGTGYFAQAAKPHRPEWHVIGVDIAHGMCRVANTRCTAVNADAARLPLADVSLDAAVSALCYQWVEQLPAAFVELARVLKPQGRAVIASLGHSTLTELRNCAEMVGLPLSLLAMPSYAAMIHALQGAGFSMTMHEVRHEVRHYPSVTALLDSMRTIGAGNNFTGNARGLTGPKRWAAMVQAYEGMRVAEGIPATWEHHFFVVSKQA
jgi:malonyl-CoA O-methyltransferase